MELTFALKSIANRQEKFLNLRGSVTSILVVEDNPMNMELVTCLLESNGIEVTQALDGLEALDKIKISL